MPSIVTHYLFSEDVLANTKEEIQKNILKSHQIYNTFAQSFDNFFYYNLLNLKKGKKIREFGNYAQRNYSNEYFKNLINAIKNQKQEKNPDVLAYLYGSLTHYILDSTAHPFIIYQAGWQENIKDKKQFRGNHEKIEVTIDAIYWKEKRKNELIKQKISDTLLPKINFSNELKIIINETYKNTFKKDNIALIYEKSVKQGHHIIKYFVTDRYGFKKQVYKLFDTIFFKNNTMYQYLSFYIKKPNKLYLNRNHEKWCYPTDNTKTSHESFDQLYDKALNKAIEIFDLTNKVINNKFDIEIYLKKLGNKSYITGKDWNLKEEIKYFKNQN